MNETEARARYPSATQEAAAAAESAQASNPADRLREPPGDVLAGQHERAKDAAPRLKHIGGSDDDAFNIALAEATRQTAWITDVDSRNRSLTFAGKALAGIGPRDELEAMLSAQMVAMHQASMECSRRAMIDGQSVDGRAMNLKAAARASQTYAQLLGALDKHRNKGRQRVTVEHLYVADGGRAIIGNVEAGGRETAKNDGQPHAPRLAHAPAPLAPMWGKDQSREAVPVASDAEREVQDARRHEPRRAAR